MSSRSKGGRYERRLVRALDAGGYHVMKSPSSGAGTSRDQPDILAIRDDEVLAIEQKYTSDPEGTVYLDPEELLAIETVASTIGRECAPRVTVRWARDGAFYVFDPDDIPMTSGGDGDSYRISRELVHAETQTTAIADVEVKRHHGLGEAELRGMGVLGSETTDKEC